LTGALLGRRIATEYEAIAIQGPVEDVYAYTSAVDTMPEWRGDVSEAEGRTVSRVRCRTA
jgi:hypothetical protein